MVGRYVKATWWGWFDDNLIRGVWNGTRTVFFGRIYGQVMFPSMLGLGDSYTRELTVAEMCQLGWGEGGDAWKWKWRLRACEEDLLGECCVMLHNVVLQVTVEDRWQWLLDLVKGYTINKFTIIYFLLKGLMMRSGSWIFDTNRCLWRCHY